MRGLLTALNVASLAPVGAAVVAPWVPPAPWWPPTAAALVLGWWALIPAAWALVWWSRQPIRLALNLLALAALAYSALPMVQLNRALDPHPDEFSLLSLNAKAFDYDRRNVAKLEELLARERPDILVMQEYWTGYQSGSEAVIERVKRAGDFTHARVIILVPNNFGMAVFSKFPLGKAERVTDPGRRATNGIMRVPVRIGDLEVQLFNLHLQSYNLDRVERTLLDSLPAGGVEADRMLSTLGRMRKAWAKQRQQLRVLVHQLPPEGTPTLLAGDLNNPPTTWVAHQLSRRYRDSFAERGAGLGTTYGRGLSAFRIDYVFASPEIEVRGHTTVETELSDHRAVKVRLRLPSAEASE